MARIILALCLLISSVVSAQPGYTNINARYKWIAGGFDSSLILPRYNGVPSGLRSAWNTDGQLAADTANNHLYVYSGGAWIRLANYSDVSSYTFTNGLVHNSGFVGLDSNGVNPLTRNVLIDADGNDFTIQNASVVSLESNNGGDNSGTIEVQPTQIQIQVEESGTGSNIIYMNKDSTKFQFFKGQANIDSLREASNMTNKAVMVWEKTTGRWERIDKDSVGGGGSGTVTSVATNNGTGITGGTITGSGTLAIDTANTIATRLQVQHRIDSLAALKQRKINYLDSSFKLTNDSLLWRDYVNIKSFGAIDDDATDNSTALANAVATGRPVFIPATGKNFRYSTGIVLNPGQVIFGLGQDSRLKYTGTVRAIRIVDSCKVLNLSLEGNGKSSGNAFETGILAYDDINWTISGCSIFNFGGNPTSNGGGGIYATGLALFESEGGNIIDTRVYNCNVGFHLGDRGEYVNIIGGTAFKNNTGIACAAGNFTFSGVVVENNTTGMRFYYGANNGHGSITGCLINHNITPLDINDIPYSVGLSFSNNQIFFGGIKITNSNNINFNGGSISQMDSIHLNNSRFIRRSNVFWGVKYGGTEIPVYKYNNSDDFEVFGSIRRDSASANYYIKQLREDTVRFKLPTAPGVYAVRIDEEGNLSKADTTFGAGSGIASLNSQTGSTQTMVAGTPDLTISSGGDVHTFSIKYDTVTHATFSAGARFEADTALFTTSTIYGSFYWAGSDTLIITDLNGVMNGGTSDTLGVQLYYNDTLNVTAGADSLFIIPTPLNSTTMGNIPDADEYIGGVKQIKIPPGRWVWMKSPDVIAGRKPYYLSVSLIGYKKRI